MRNIRETADLIASANCATSARLDNNGVVLSTVGLRVSTSRWCNWALPCSLLGRMVPVAQ
jgi:hypothetical protein